MSDYMIVDKTGLRAYCDDITAQMAEHARSQAGKPMEAHTTFAHDPVRALAAYETAKQASLHDEEVFQRGYDAGWEARKECEYD